MSISLIAVFIPILLMGGIVGRLFREFAMTLSIAILISLVVSLTTTPMMCALLLRARSRPKPRAGFYRRQRARLRRDAERLRAHAALGARPSAASIMLILAGDARAQRLSVRRHPEGLLPAAGHRPDDRRHPGRPEHFVPADAAEADAVRRHHQEGSGGRHRRRLHRRRPDQYRLRLRVAEAARRSARSRPTRSSPGCGGKLAVVPGATLFLQAVQDIRVGGRASNAQYQYTLQGDTLEELNDWAPKIAAALQNDAATLADVNSDQQNKGLETDLVIDRDDRGAARHHRRARSTTRSTTPSASARSRPSTSRCNQYHVVMEVAPQFWQSPETLKDVYVSTVGRRGRRHRSRPMRSPEPSSATGAIGLEPPLGRNRQAPAIVATNSIGATGNGVRLDRLGGQHQRETMIPLSAVAHFAPGQRRRSRSIIRACSSPPPSRSTCRRACRSATRRRPSSKRHEPASACRPRSTAASRARRRSFSNRSTTEPFLILAALVAVYIVLGVLYESYVHPSRSSRPCRRPASARCWR